MFAGLRAKLTRRHAWSVTPRPLIACMCLRVRVCQGCNVIVLTCHKISLSLIEPMWALVFADSRFIGFGGTEPPFLIAQETFATFRNCKFEDFDLTVEVFDVSFGGLLHLEQCTFQRILLRQSKLVSTSLNDEVKCLEPFQDDFLYMSTDDEAYDIPLEQIDPSNPDAGMRVTNETLSDCLRARYKCAHVTYHDLHWSVLCRHAALRV